MLPNGFQRGASRFSPLGWLMAMATSVAFGQPANPVGFTGGDSIFTNFVAASDAGGTASDNPFFEIGWTRGDEGSTFAAWENFAAIRELGQPALNAPAIPAETIEILGQTFTVGVENTPLPLLPTGGSASVSFVAQTLNDPIVTSTLNLYTAGSQGDFVVQSTGEGLGAGYDTRIVLQIGTLGNVPEPGTFRLQYIDGSGETVETAALFNLELQSGGDTGSPMGGVSEERAVVFNIAGFNPEEISLSVGAGSNLSLSSVILDTFAQPAVPTIAGDFSGNGIVDDLDYSVFLSQFGSVGINADGNQDAVVNGADFVLFRDTFGSDAFDSSTASSPATRLAPSAVPEPATMIGCLAAVLGMIGCRHRSIQSSTDLST